MSPYPMFPNHRLDPRIGPMRLANFYRSPLALQYDMNARKFRAPKPKGRAIFYNTVYILRHLV